MNSYSFCWIYAIFELNIVDTTAKLTWYLIEIPLLKIFSIYLKLKFVCFQSKGKVYLSLDLKFRLASLQFVQHSCFPSLSSQTNLFEFPGWGKSQMSPKHISGRAFQYILSTYKSDIRWLFPRNPLLSESMNEWKWLSDDSVFLLPFLFCLLERLELAAFQENPEMQLKAY